MALRDFVKAAKKSSLLGHLKNIDEKTARWRRDLLDAVVTKDELDILIGTYTSHADLADRELDEQHPATAVETDTTGFGGALSSADDDVQAALDTIDDDLARAIHDNVAEEIYDITQETEPTGSDLIVIESFNNGWQKRSVALEDLPFGSSTGGGAELSIDFEDDEGYVSGIGDTLEDQGDWTKDDAGIWSGDWIPSEQTPPGGGAEGAALVNPLWGAGSGSHYRYNAASWSSGVLDIYFRTQVVSNQFAGMSINDGDAWAGSDKALFGLVTTSGGVATGFKMVLENVDTYTTTFGTVNSTTAYWIRAQLDIDGGYARMKGWSGNLGDEPGGWQAERNYGAGGFDTPVYMSLFGAQGSTNPSYVEVYQIITTNPETSGGTIGDIDHGVLDGLDDDDHTQYLLADGTRGLSADWDAGSHKITAETFTSVVTSPTPPFTVASTAAVSSLNADLLDDYDAADMDYSFVTGNDGATDVTAAELEELTDGSTTTLHQHAISDVAVVPSTVTLNTGSNTAGDVDSFGVALDGDTYDVDEVTGVPGFDIELDFTGVTDFDQIWVRMAYNGTTSHVLNLLLYNYNTTTYDTISRILTFGAGSYTWFVFPVPVDTNYIDSGAVNLKIYHATSGNAAHDVSVDYVGLINRVAG